MKNSLFTTLGLVLLASSASAGELNRFAVVEPGVLYRSSKPITESDFDGLHKLKVGTIISFEEKDKINGEDVMAGKRGIDFINIPLNGHELPSDEAIQRLEAIYAKIRAEKNLPQEQRTIQLPVVIHCFHGKDRTGLAGLLYRLGGKPANEINLKDLACARLEMKAFGYRAWTNSGIKDYLKIHYDKILSPKQDRAVCDKTFKQVNAKAMTIAAAIAVDPVSVGLVAAPNQPNTPATPPLQGDGSR
jgi:hypothetical protein